MRLISDPNVDGILKLRLFDVYVFARLRFPSHTDLKTKKRESTFLSLRAGWWASGEGERLQVLEPPVAFCSCFAGV
jgi:hypothetical protein